MAPSRLTIKVMDVPWNMMTRSMIVGELARSIRNCNEEEGAPGPCIWRRAQSSGRLEYFADWTDDKTSIWLVSRQV